MDCFANLIGVAECGKSRSGITLYDFPELRALLTDCCSKPIYKKAQQAIDVAYKRLWSDLLIFSTEKLNTRNSRIYKIGYTGSRSNSSLGDEFYQGIVIDYATGRDGAFIEIEALKITSDNPTVDVILVNKEGIEISKATIKSGLACSVNWKVYCEDMPCSILYPSQKVVKVLDSCPCHGWKDSYNTNSTYGCTGCGSSRNKPRWADELMIGGVQLPENIPNISSITEASKDLNGIESSIKVGCSKSSWICANPYNEDNALHHMIANAIYYKAASLIMRTERAKIAIDRTNILATQGADMFIENTELAYDDFVTKIIDYVSDNYLDMESCFSCKESRYRDALL